MITVEFYGIPRQRAGVARTTLAATPRTLGDLRRELHAQFPHFDVNERFAVNLNGERFVTDPATPLADGACVLILSADAGG